MLQFSRFTITAIIAIVLCAFVAAAPNFLNDNTRSALPAWLQDSMVRLGLDLQGGAHIVVEVDIEGYEAEQAAQYRQQMRRLLLEQKIGYTSIVPTENNITATLRSGTYNQDDLRAALRGAFGQDALISMQKDQLSISFSEQAISERKKKLLTQSVSIINRRINSSGTKEPLIQQQGENRIVVQVPGAKNPDEVKRLLMRTAKLSFHLLDEQITPQQMQNRSARMGTRFLADAEDPLLVYPVRYPAELSGEHLEEAGVSYENGQPVVTFGLDTLGASKFATITRENQGKQFAAVLDGQVITAPRINTPIIGGQGIITGNFTAQSASELAVLLNSGALPADISIVEERSVGPSLGADSIRAGKIASILAITSIMMFMLLAYGLFGVFANIALLLNMVMLFSALSIIGATLTLPGIAGIVLTMGMAVDANVLVFERIREEMRSGAHTFAVLDRGFKAAFGTIFDSNITTLIAGAILFTFGTGAVKGFAVTLSLGIVTSMFSTTVLTRLMIALWVKRARPSVLPI